MNQRIEIFHTMNLMVAATLLTYGFKFVTYTRIVRADGKTSFDFWFNSKSDACDMTAEQLAVRMTKGCEVFEDQDPAHPLNAIRRYKENREALIEVVKKTPEMVTISNGERKAMIAGDASETLKRQIAEIL